MLLPELVHLLPCLLSHTTCSLVYPFTRQLTMLLLELVHLLPCLLQQVTCSPVPSFPCLLPPSPVSSRIQLVNSSPRQLVNLPVTHRTCSSVTMSIKHPTCPPVSPSTRQLTMLLIELVHLLPCLLIHLTCSLVHSLTRLLVNYFYHLTFLSVLVQNTATQILPFLSPTSTVKNVTINKTSH